MRRPADQAGVPYELSCPCGQPLRGQRQGSAQIAPCPNCGRKHFLLPNTAWLAPAAAARQSGYANLNRLLVVIVLGGALAMILILLAFLYLLHPEERTKASSAEEASRAHFVQGELHLHQGNIFLALEELNAALEQSRLPTSALNREERRDLERMWRQTDLLAHLLDRPLEEIVRQAMQHRSEEEWSAKFAQYRGRTVVFDDVLRRGPQDRPVLAFYVVNAAARVALEDLTLLRQLPLDPPSRWLFGARLSGLRREEGGVWVFHFEPDSAVLLSEAMIAELCCPMPLDADLDEVLRRQKQWLQR
jgi:hypothetical protein